MASFSPFARPQAPLTLNRARQQARIQEELAREQQDADRRARLVSAGQAMRTAAIRNGALPSSLPEFHPGMSHADIAAANERLAPLTGSHLPFSNPGLSVDEARGVVDLKRQEMGLPSTDAAQASNATAAKVASAAGTNQQVQTPYGTVSSRPASWMDKVGDQYGKDWQQQVVDKYPKVGVAGTPENVAFVAAVKMAHEDPNSQYEKDPMKIAAFTSETGTSEPTKTFDYPNATPSRTAMLSGTNGAPMPAAPPPVSPALQMGKDAGAAVSSRWEQLQQQPDSPRSIINNVGQYAHDASDAVRGFFNPSATSAPYSPILPNNPSAVNPTASAPAVPAVSPVTKPPMPFQASPAAPQAPSVSVSGAPLPFQSSPVSTNTLAAFSRNPEDEQFQKQLQSNPPSLFQS